MARWEGENNESMYERCNMGVCVNRVVWSNGKSEKKYNQMVWSYENVEMIYLRNGCGVKRIDNESNERVYSKFDMSIKSEGIKISLIMR